MADESKKDHPEDIESILSDLDAILTDMGGDAKAAPKPETPAKAPPPASPPPPPAKQPSIELSPREGMIKPPEKKAEPPKPAEPAKPMGTPKAPAPVPALPKATPAPTAVPVPAPSAADAKTGELPADTPKEQIRRVAYIYTSSCSEVRTTFALFLSQSARTISKKPLFLREVLAHEVAAASDPNAVLQKALQAKAVAVLAVVEGWPAAKLDELAGACSRANLLFRAVASGDAQKKSTAVDIIVDLMLLPGEG